MARKVFQPKAERRNSPKELDDESKLHAKAAKLAYEDLPADKMPAGYIHERINPEISVLKNPETKRAVIGIRGTANVGDAITDLWTGLGDIKSTDRYKRTIDQIQKITDELGNEYTISLAGHSLGGALAHQAADELGLSGHIFNPAASLGDMPQTDKITAHMTEDDPVSLFFRHKGNTNIYQNPEQGVRAVHTIDQYVYGRRHGMFAYAGGASPGRPF